MPDPAYREYVQAIARGPRPSEVIMNRSAGHASVVLEILFASAHNTVNLLTCGLAAEVYGVGPTIAAALEFLGRDPEARLNILTERAIDRQSHPLLKEIDASGFSGQVSLATVTDAARMTYSFNFAVADGKDYRFEEARASREAIVQFGEPNFAASLDRWFMHLSRTAIPA